MAYDLTGTLFEIQDEQQVSDKFRKREFIVEVPDGNYTQFIKLQLTQDKCDLLDAFKTGDAVKVAFNLQGKPFTKNGTTMYFTNLGAWKIEAAGANPGPKPEPEPDLEDNSLPF